jgi:hypothetical protein
MYTKSPHCGPLVQLFITAAGRAPRISTGIAAEKGRGEKHEVTHRQCGCCCSDPSCRRRTPGS